LTMVILDGNGCRRGVGGHASALPRSGVSYKWGRIGKTSNNTTS
jgi:hypothetical protein